MGPAETVSIVPRGGAGQRTSAQRFVAVVAEAEATTATNRGYTNGKRLVLRSMNSEWKCDKFGKKDISPKCKHYHALDTTFKQLQKTLWGLSDYFEFKHNLGSREYFFEGALVFTNVPF